MSEAIIFITREIHESIAVKTQILASCCPQITDAATSILKCLRSGGKLIALGNGGSAAEAEHLVTEFVGRYRTDRQPLAAVSLTTDSTSLTAIGNDYGFEQVFCRQLQAVAKAGDVLLAISTSGNSRNVLRSVEFARTAGVTTVALTGLTGGLLRPLVDICISVPSDSTPRIQEGHTLIVHLLCGLIENAVALGAQAQWQTGKIGEVL